ncbi:hypothetical protein G6F46_015293 [Rhizopus delemar]|nr:hypothetical protein G6F46_015293 [Rhizopus delemar]
MARRYIFSIGQRLDVHRAIIQVQAGVQRAGAALGQGLQPQQHADHELAFMAQLQLAGAALDHLERVPLLGVIERAALLQHRLQLLQVARGVVASISQRGDPGQFGRAGRQRQ